MGHYSGSYVHVFDLHEIHALPFFLSLHCGTIYLGLLSVFMIINAVHVHMKTWQQFYVLKLEYCNRCICLCFCETYAYILSLTGSRVYVVLGPADPCYSGLDNRVRRVEVGQSH